MNQETYFLRELNRALPVQRGPADSATINAAIDGVDPSMPAGTRQAVNDIRLFSQFGQGADSVPLQRDAACRAYTAPSQAMRADPTSRTGCGWWYSADPNVNSVGSYGTRRGPMNPNLTTQVGPGQWVWDINQAIQMEAAKQANRVAACTDLPYAQQRFPTMGWCNTTNRAVLTDGNGNPAFPRAPGGDCDQSQIVTNAANCPPPPSAGGGAGGAGGGGISGLCSTSPLTPACLQSLATQYCQPGGALAKAYSGGGMPAQNSQFNLVNQVLQQRGGFTLPSGVVSDGNISSASALSAFQQLSALSVQPGLDSRAAAAAANLCNGTPFDPCAYAPTDKGPYEQQCVAQAALAQGYSPNGTALSSGSMAFWNSMPQWQNVLGDLASIKQTADVPGYNGLGPVDQANAIMQVYGTKINYPKSGCNNTGAFVYRYLNIVGGQFNPSATPTPQTPITHFLGRYILKNGITSSQAASMTEMTPGGQNLTEIFHIQTNWTPMEAGDSNFEVYADDVAVIYFGNTLYALIGCCSQYQVTDPLTWLTPGTTYPLHIFTANSGGPWSFSLQRCTPSTQTSGGACNDPQPIPVTELSMPQDRRLPMLEYAFHKMQPVTVSTSSSGIPIADTNSVFANCVMAASIGQLNGRQCMIVDGPARGIFNYNASAAPPNNYVQGMRLHALKSFTMMICITGMNTPNGNTPSIFSLYNLPQSNTNGIPSVAWQPWFVQPFSARTNAFEITANQSVIYPYGNGPSTSGASMASIFTEAIQSGESIAAYPPNAWFHYAWVWDDNGTGYTIYLNGKQVGRSFMPAYDPALIMEQWRIGCDNQPEGQSWTGGIQWFRGFDYRLSQDQVVMDMQDNWANLV